MLILRVTLGITALFLGRIYLSEPDHPTFSMSIIGLLAIVSGILLLIGFLTPVVCPIVFAGNAAAVILSVASNQNAAVLPEIYAIGLAAAVALLGPGAFSLDARIFGRREIIIPPKSSALNT